MLQKLAITRTCFEEAQKRMRMRAIYPPTFGGNSARWCYRRCLQLLIIQLQPKVAPNPLAGPIVDYNCKDIEMNFGGEI